MKSRRNFLQISGLASMGAIFSNCNAKAKQSLPPAKAENFPVVVSTWNFGMEANKDAWKILEGGGNSLDAVESGVRGVESDINNTSVGKGGFPDRDGYITLDACIMDHLGRCGSTAYLQDIEHPISVARKIMETTPHVMLVGKGAQKFAIANGFNKIDLHTEKSKKGYEDWLVKSEYRTIINSENHDTIGMLAMDRSGKIAGACTTSGMAFKMAGRVGDSPIIGAGLYLDPEVGGAVATGLGEEIIRVAGSAMIVEQMRGGATPQEACMEIVNRVKKRNTDLSDKQVCFIALDKYGNSGSYSLYEGFQYAQRDESGAVLNDSPFFLKY